MKIEISRDVLGLQKDQKPGDSQWGSLGDLRYSHPISALFAVYVICIAHLFPHSHVNCQVQFLGFALSSCQQPFIKP